MFQGNELLEKKKKIIRIRNRGLAFMVAFVPSVALLDAWVDMDWLTKTIGAACFIGALGHLLVASLSKCPRCHKFFFWTGLRANGFASNCLNCKL